MIVAAIWTGILILASLQVIYGLYFFRHVWRISHAACGINHRSGVPEFATEPVSVIICAHNEAGNLGSHLPQILDLDYRWPDGSPAFEVIVVNDSSTDTSEAILAAIGETNLHLRVITTDPKVARTSLGKKYPLSLAVAAARHNWIVCTDADCAPASLAWLHFMVAPLASGKEIVAGYGGYHSTKGLLNSFIRYETNHTFLQYYSFAHAGLPYMAVGRNLAATKAVFQQASQHPAWAQLPSGDDDLLVQLCATSTNMSVLAHPASFTWSAPKEELKDYLGQKQRHVSTGKYYTARTKLAVGGYALLNAMWWVLLILVISADIPRLGLVVLLFPMMTLMVTFQHGSSLLREKTTVLGWLLFSLCWMLYNAVLAPYILWKTKQRWK
jgi:hypothetical protein